MQKTDYASLAESYAAHRRANPEVLRRLTAAIDPSSRVLEIGCGTGNYSSALRHTTGCAMVGIDPSREMLAKLRAAEPDVEAHEGRAERLVFHAENFDLAFSVDVIHHVDDHQAAFNEAFRVLRHGGAVCTVTDSEWIIRHREPQSVYFPETIDIELARYPTIDALRAKMQNAGFEQLHEDLVEHAYELTDAAPYRDKVFSSLHGIGDAAFRRGLDELERDLTRGPVRCVSRYLMLWGKKGK